LGVMIYGSGGARPGPAGARAPAEKGPDFLLDAKISAIRVHLRHT